MDRPKNGSSVGGGGSGGNGKQSPYKFNNSASSTPPQMSSTSQADRRHPHQPLPMNPTAFYGNPGGIPADLHYPLNNGVYYSNPQTPTMRSPPPGFASNTGMFPPGQGYQHHHMMQNIHVQNPRGAQCPQNFYPVGFAQQPIPMFNNNFGGGGPAPSEIGIRPNSFHALAPNQTQQGHQHQEYFPHGVVNENMYNNNGSHGLGGVEMDTNAGSGLRPERNRNGIGSPVGGEGNSAATSSDKTQNSINPLIDNIVGSMMFNGVNGAYTHFGPTGGIPGVSSYPASSLSADYEQQQHDEGPTQFGVSSPSPVMMGTGGLGRNAHVSNSASPGTVVMSDMHMNDNRQQECSPTHLRRPSNSASGAPQISGRSSTPSDTADNNNSRPQTPNKPSYSEILAKNSSSGNTTPYRKAASAVPAAPTISKGSSKENLAGASNKKSDAPTLSSGSSANSSSCTSLSSSPVAKQKTLSQTIMGRLFTAQPFGKENTAVVPPKTSSYSRTPSSTPTHQRKPVTTEAKHHDDRKILSSQNSSGNVNTKIKPLVKKVSKDSGGVFSEPNPGDQEQKQMQPEDDDGNWKTYSTRNKHTSVAARQSSSFQALSSNPSSGHVEGEASSESTSKASNGSVFANSSNNEGDENDEGENDDDVDVGGTSRRESLNDSRKSGNSFGTSSSNSSSTSAYYPSTSTTGGGGGGSQTQRKSREKERPKNKKDGRSSGTVLRRCERIVYLWAATMISAMAWLVKLVTSVFTLSVSVGSTLLEDLYSWWINKALPAFFQQYHMIEETLRVSARKLKQSFSWDKLPFRRKTDTGENQDFKKNSEELLAALGPDKNVQITNADETLKRLLSCKGQDPYSILGVRSDSSDETIRRYYKKQAVLVHPDKNAVVGAEEAFKILGKAFELLGESSKRQEYHSKLFEAHAKEQVYGEIGKLLEQLRKKMEIATSSIRCTKCNLRHKKNKTDRPLFAARFCAQCNIHHASREGELWAESRGWFGLSWTYFTCMDTHIWEINEWAKCQKKNLLHIKADSHCVMYRLVAGGGNSGGAGGQQFPGGPDGQHVDPDDDWDSLINNLYKTGGVAGNKGGDHFYQQAGSSGGAGSGFYSGGGSTGSGGPSSSSNANGAAAGRKRKGKRK